MYAIRSYYAFSVQRQYPEPYVTTQKRKICDDNKAARSRRHWCAKAVMRLPLESRHQTVQPAADPQKRDLFPRLEDIALVGDRGGQRQGDGPHVAEEFVGGEILFGRDSQGVKNGFLVGRPDLMADDSYNFV